MNRFPFSAVSTTGSYYYRSRPEKSWNLVKINIESCLISFFGTSGELDLDYIKHNRVEAELYGPIPVPPANAPLDDQPYPF